MVGEVSVHTTLASHLIEIARCPFMAACLDGDAKHACAKVVLKQWEGIAETERKAHWQRVHQLPEPWEGHLDQARILFVSSNPSLSGHIRLPPRQLERDPNPVVDGHSATDHPSISRAEGPKWDWGPDELVDRYQSAFDVYIERGIRARGAGRSTRYWIWARARARELMPDRSVQPGIDYALTEVVRCKTKNEVGVREARETCAQRYLERTLRCARADVLIVAGTHARVAVNHVFGLSAAERSVHELTTGDRPRLAAFVRHPAGRGPKMLARQLEQADLERLRHAVD